MSGRKYPILFALCTAVTVVVIAACGVGQTSAPSQAGAKSAPASTSQSPAPVNAPTTSPATEAVTAAELVAVGQHIWFGPGGNPCYRFTIASCPVTERLIARIQEIERPPSTGPGPVNSWCRCQNAANVTMAAEVSGAGGTTHVTFNNDIKVDFIIVEQQGRLLVDDTRCTGHGSSTSIYSTQLIGCA